MLVSNNKCQVECLDPDKMKTIIFPAFVVISSSHSFHYKSYAYYNHLHLNIRMAMMLKVGAYYTKPVLCNSSLMHKTLPFYSLSFYQVAGKITFAVLIST